MRSSHGKVKGLAILVARKHCLGRAHHQHYGGGGGAEFFGQKNLARAHAKFCSAKEQASLT